MGKRLSALLVLALAACSARVAVGLILREDMWARIVFYWILLTVKNLVDWRNTR